MANVELYDDPIWPYVLHSKLQPYIEHVRKFWDEIDQVKILGTGVFPIVGPNVPAGLFYRMTNTPVRSPIKHVQVFPFVPTSYLQITGVAGGSNRMVSRVCAGGFEIQEFTIVEKSNLPSTYHQGQFVAFIPTNIFNGSKSLGKWIYLTAPEMAEIATKDVSKSIKEKMIKEI